MSCLPQYTSLLSGGALHAAFLHFPASQWVVLLAKVYTFEFSPEE